MEDKNEPENEGIRDTVNNSDAYIKLDVFRSVLPYSVSPSEAAIETNRVVKTLFG